MITFFRTFLMKKWVLYLLLLCNIAGTIYGYYWYIPQFEITPWYFLPFVPDSPNASLFFCIVLLAFIIGKNWGLFEALAFTSLIKYGIWAVVMNIIVLFNVEYFAIQGFLLIFSHAIMAIQAYMYAPFYNMKTWHIAAAAILLLHNEIIDYVFGMMPMYSMLTHYIKEIGYFTFWLSIATILVTIYIYKQNKKAIKS